MKEENTQKYSFDDFLEIVKILRGENGCPWDKEQTHYSLRPEMMEEAAEVCAAIRLYEQTGEDWNLKEELGDVLLQVVMHSQIAGEEGRFTIDDVIQGIAEKMVRRHPHVFGKVQVKDSNQVLENWEEIKRKEKHGGGEADQAPLHQIPHELPALTRGVKVLKKVNQLYQEQDNSGESLQKIQKAIETLEKMTQEKSISGIEQEVGDILIAVSNISRIFKISQEQILSDRLDDLIETYENPAKSQ
jgi:tetrapyrrole methylase family protein/MazG family protein